MREGLQKMDTEMQASLKTNYTPKFRPGGATSQAGVHKFAGGEFYKDSPDTVHVFANTRSIRDDVCGSETVKCVYSTVF